MRAPLIAAGLAIVALTAGCGPKAPPPGAVATKAPAAKPAATGPQAPVKPVEPIDVAEVAGKRVLMVIAPGDFRDEEYQYPANALTGGGAVVTVASTRRGKFRGVGGAEAEATLAVADADPGEYDAVVFIGGPGMLPHLQDKAMLSLATSAREARKTLAAICVAPSILANAGVLKGIPATAYEDQRANLKARGAQLSPNHVVASGDIITADGPAAAEEFATALGKALSPSKQP